MNMPNNNSANQIFAANSVVLSPLIFPTVVDTPGFTLGSIIYNGTAFVYSAVTSPGGAAVNIEYLAWGGNIIQLGDVGTSGGSSDPTDVGIIEIDFACTHLGNIRFLFGNNVPGIVNPITINESGLTFSKLLPSGTAPAIATNAGAGTGATVSATGVDNAFQITLTTGTTPAGGAVFTVTFATAFAVSPKIIVGAANGAASAAFNAGTWGTISSVTVSGFVWTVPSIAASTQLIYHVVAF